MVFIAQSNLHTRRDICAFGKYSYIFLRIYRIWIYCFHVLGEYAWKLSALVENMLIFFRRIRRKSKYAERIFAFFSEYAERVFARIGYKHSLLVQYAHTLSRILLARLYISEYFPTTPIYLKIAVSWVLVYWDQQKKGIRTNYLEMGLD